MAHTVQSRPDVTFSLRLPGWLLIAVLVSFASYFVVVNVRHAIESNESTLGGPVRVTVLNSRTANGVFSADAILESNKTIETPGEGWSVVMKGGPTVPAVATVKDTGSRNTHAIRVHLFAEALAGQSPQLVNYEGSDHSFSGSWQAGVPAMATPVGGTQ